MATLTAQVLIGSTHPNHDGINPTHYLFLSENNRPAWMLVEQNIAQADQTSFERITWIPSVENMLEDAILMVAVHIVKDQGVLEMAKAFSNNIESKRLEVYEELIPSERNMLYLKCQDISEFPKFIISVFRDATIEKQLPILEKYKMDIEVCSPVYSRLYSRWSKKLRIEGSLKS